MKAEIRFLHFLRRLSLDLSSPFARSKSSSKGSDSTESALQIGPVPPMPHRVVILHWTLLQYEIML